jgi:hypothetical protein
MAKQAAMKIDEVKKSMNRKVLYEGTEYTLTAYILRKSDGFYHQAEILDKTKHSVLIVPLEKVKTAEK